MKKGEVDHPWKATKDPREKWVTIIPLIGLALGFVVAGYLVYNGLSTIVNHTYTLVLDEDWSKGFNTDVWTKEVNLGGFGYAAMSKAQHLLFSLLTVFLETANSNKLPARKKMS